MGRTFWQTSVQLYCHYLHACIGTAACTFSDCIQPWCVQKQRMQQAALERQSSLWGQELLLTKQALVDVTAAQQKTAQVRGLRLTFAALHAVR